MKGKRYTTEDKIRILREADGGKTGLDIYRWKRVFGMMEVSEARRLKELEREG